MATPCLLGSIRRASSLPLLVDPSSSLQLLANAMRPGTMLCIISVNESTKLESQSRSLPPPMRFKMSSTPATEVRRAQQAAHGHRGLPTSLVARLPRKRLRFPHSGSHPQPSHGHLQLNHHMDPYPVASVAYSGQPQQCEDLSLVVEAEPALKSLWHTRSRLVQRLSLAVICRTKSSAIWTTWSMFARVVTVCPVDKSALLELTYTGKHDVGHLHMHSLKGRHSSNNVNHRPSLIGSFSSRSQSRNESRNTSRAESRNELEAANYGTGA